MPRTARGGSAIKERSAQASSRPAVTGVGVVGLSRFALGTSAAVGTATLPNYDYVVLGTSDSSYLPAIKSASPATTVLGFHPAV
jgi:hypothetical protein